MLHIRLLGHVILNQRKRTVESFRKGLFSRRFATICQLSLYIELELHIYLSEKQACLQVK